MVHIVRVSPDTGNGTVAHVVGVHLLGRSRWVVGMNMSGETIAAGSNDIAVAIMLMV
jgi:hypothetical protein